MTSNRLANLATREKEVCTFVARGMTNSQIADAMGITEGTVKVNLTHIFDKTGTKDRRELAELWNEEAA